MLIILLRFFLQKDLLLILVKIIMKKKIDIKKFEIIPFRKKRNSCKNKTN